MKTPQTNIARVRQDSLEEFARLLPDAIQEMKDMIRDREVPPQVRAHLIDVILERVLGKTEQTFNLIAHESSMEDAARKMEGFMASLEEEYGQSNKTDL